MTTTTTLRRPRFLESVPAAPGVSPLRLPQAPQPAAVRPVPLSAASAARAADAASPPSPPALRDAREAESRREALARVGAAVETLRAQAAQLGEQARADALEIGFAVARAILATEIRQSPEALFSLVRAAVRRAGESRRVVVRVAPEDLEVLQDAAGKGAGEALFAARVELVADRSLKRGDCLVDADFGRVDGRLDTRLAELRRAIEAEDDELREGVA